jgi:hypothetical protein
MTEPTFGPNQDVITVQPYEKPMVLNIDTDILVTVVGN